MMDNREKILTSAQVRNKTIISFLFFFLFIGGCYLCLEMAAQTTQRSGALKPLRTVLDANESFFTCMLFSSNHLTKTYSKAEAVPRVRVNGDAGLSSDFDPDRGNCNL